MRTQALLEKNVETIRDIGETSIRYFNIIAAFLASRILLSWRISGGNNEEALLKEGSAGKLHRHHLAFVQYRHASTSESSSILTHKIKSVSYYT